MARSILAELSVILKDGVSGKAKEVVNSLGKIEKAADSLGKAGKGNGALNQTADALGRINKAAVDLAKTGQRMGDWGAQFERRVIKIGASAADIERLKASWQSLNAELNKVGAKGAFRTDALRAWKSESLAGLLAVRTGADAASRSLGRMGQSARAAHRELAMVSNLTRTLGFGGATYAGQVGLRAGGKAAAEYHRETQARQPFAGISPTDRAALQAKAMGLSTQYKSVDATTLNTLGRSLYNMTGDMPKAIDLLEDFTKAYVVLQTAMGKEGADKQLDDFSKALDIFGRQDDPAQMREILNSALKATQVEGRQLPLTEFLKLAKYAKSAGAALSPEFIGAIAPSFLQEAGGQRTGTALGSMVSQMIGNRLTKKALAAQYEAGIRQGEEVILTPEDMANQQKAGVRSKAGDVVDPGLLMSNPYDWAQKYLGPAMKAEGFDPNANGQEANVTKFMSKIFSNQMVADIFTKMFTQSDQINRNRLKLYPNAMGLDAADKAKNVDPFVALEGVASQLRNFASILGEAGITESITKGLNAISGGLSSLNEVLNDNKGVANIAAHLLAVGAALTAIRTAVAGWTLLKAFMPGAAGAAGGSGAVGAAGAAAGVAGRAGMRFVPGVGWILAGADTAYRLWNGEGDVAPGDAEDRASAMAGWARRQRGAGRSSVPGSGFNLGGPAALGGAPQTVGSGLNNFGFGPAGTKLDSSAIDATKTKAEETNNVLDQLGNQRKASVDSTEVQRVLTLAQQANAELDKLTQKASTAANAIQNKLTQQTRAAMRSLYSDTGTETA